MGLATAIAESLFPPVCPVTGEETSARWTLAPQAWSELTRLEQARGCAKCSRPIPGLARSASGPPALCEPCFRARGGAGRPWERGAAAFLYERSGRSLVLAFKEADRLDLAPLISGWMLEAAPNLVADADLVAPVPLAWPRLVARRYNQSAELARTLCRLAGRRGAYAPRLLRRIRNTPRQARLEKTEREANVAGAFVLRARAGGIAGRRVLLVDDVMTTGATLSAAADVCLAGGAAAVDVLVSALVPDPDRPYVRPTTPSDEEDIAI